MRSAYKPVAPKHILVRISLALACAALALPHANVQRAYAATVPAEATLIAPATTPLGQNVSLNIAFDNVGGATGYGPYINLFMPAAGADGGAGAPNDGIDLVSATFLGSAITTYALNCPAGGSVRSPLTGLTVTCPLAPAGINKLYVLQLPFGSFTAPQAPAVVVIAASVSNLADVGVPLPISAQAGFIYGDSPTNLEPSQGPLTTASVAPSLFTLTKASDEPEGETATGRNFERVYTLTPAMPAGIPATNIVITETLPPDVVLVSVSGASVITGPAIPGGPYAPPNNQIVFNYGPLVGSGAPITLRYYISKTNALGADVLPTGGGNSPRSNTVTGSGAWAPLDPRDASSPITATTSLTTTNRTLALQKSVRNGGTDPAPPTRPADVLTYTLNFQLSDFFSLGTVYITDTFADGQSYVPGSAALSVSERGSNVAGAFPAAALAVTNLGGAGTRMVFNVSQALPLLGATDGVLQGGYAITPTTGPAIGTLTYRVQVNDVYANGNSLLSTDRLSNTAVLAGNVLNNINLSQVIGTASDTTAAGFQVLGQPTLSKSFYAINGSTTLPSPLKLSPGDSVTYRIIYTLGTGDFNNLTVTDFLPLPVHDASLITSFISSTAGIPAAGVVQWGPGMTASDLSRVPLPTLTANAASNGFVLGFGSRQDTSNTPTQIDLVFTSRVQDKPFLDNLFLTNQANTEQTNSIGQAITRNAIQPFITAAPRVRVRKGIVGSSNPSSVLTSTAGPVVFAPVGTTACAARFVGTLNSANQATNPIDAYLDAYLDANLQNADAGDVIRMAILAENIGSALQGAFDMAVSDALPANLSFVPGSLCVQRGDGALLPTSSPSTSLFTTGITLGVPLSQGVDYAGAANSTGSNLALFTFDVLIATPVSPSQTLTNSTRLLNYASQSGSANYVPTQLPNTPVTDTAQVSVAPLRFGKQLIGTELTNANNGAAQATIGELITYTLVLTVPEGTTPNARMTDTLPTGLAFASCTGVAASSGVASTLALSPAGICSSDASGAVIAFNLGTLTNSNTNDAVTETLQITYTAVLLNVGANITGTPRTNNAQFNWAGNTPLSATASAITVIEPRLLATKASNLRFGDAFDALTFTIMLTNPVTNSTDAYDAVLTDVIPSGMTYVAGSLTSVSGPVPSFQIAAPAFTATWPALAPGQTSVLTFAVTIDPGVVPGTNLTNTARLNGSSLPGNVLARTANVNSTERSYTASNASAVFIVSPPTSGKALVNTEISITANTRTQVAIGEVLTYSVVITVPEGVTPNARLTDTLDTGLTFVNFVDITASAALQFANPIGSYLMPTLQTVGGEAGRRGVWAFGTLTNTNNNNAISETLRITYTAIALNTNGNTAGTNRRNSAVLGWSNGALPAALAQNATLIEPRLGVTKSVTPPTGDSGDVITYTIVLTGPSGTDAFDATLTDRLPFTTGSSLLLNPVIVSVNTNATPTLSAANFAIAGSNSVGYTLTSAGNFDLLLNASRRITIVLTGTLPVVVVPSAFFTNTASANFTSLDGFAQPVTRSAYNTNSTERVYTATGAAPFRILPLLATKEFITTSEGFTGNGPDGNPRVAIGEVVAYRLWIQLAESTSPNLTVDFFDNLPVNLEFITGTTRMAFVTNGGTGGITSTLVTPSTPGCGGLNVNGSSVGAVLPGQVTCPMPANAITFDVNGRPKFAFGGVSNFDTDPDGEFIIVQFSAVVKNQAANQSGVNITNTFNVLINGVLADDSPPITTTVAEPALALSKVVNAASPTDAGDSITYTLAYTNASGPNASTAFDVLLTDTIDANLDLLSVSLNAPANPISYTSAGNAVITTSNALTVSVAQLDPGASVTVLVVARVRAATSNGVRLPNTAFISYSSLPTSTGTLSNPTGTATPGASGTITGERTGAGGVNDFFAQPNAVTTTLNTPTLAKLAPISNTYAIGEAITYTLVITVPEGVAQNVSVLDDLPSGLLPVSSRIISTSYNGLVPNVAPDFANGDVLYAFGNVTTTADNLSDNDAFVVQVLARVADVPANTNGTPLTNTARLTYTNPVSGVTVLSSTQTVRVIEPSLQTSKSAIAPRSPVGAGDGVTYTIFVTNTGTATAFDLAVVDMLPSGVSVIEPFSFTWSSTDTSTNTSAYTLTYTNTSTTTNTSTITYTITNTSTPTTGLSAGASLAITFTARITDSIGPGQTLTNATQSTYSSLPGAQIGERSYTTTQATAVLTTGLPALSVSKSAEPSPVNAGELLTFTLRVTNTGTVQATNVVITDRVPTSTTLVAAPGAVQVGDVLSWTQPALGLGASATQTLTVSVDAALANGANITNTVRAQAAEGVSNTATLTVPVMTRADLAIIKTADVLTARLLDTVRFTLVISTAGPSTAQSVLVTDVLPSGLSFVSATATLGSYTHANGRWTIGPLTVGVTASLQITARVTSLLVMTNVASIGTNTTDPMTSNNISSVTITPTARFVDLAVSKSAVSGPFYSGQLISYTLAYTNSGPDVAVDTFVTDVLPSGAGFVGASAGCAQAGGNVTCNVGAVGVNASGQITVVIRAPGIAANPSTVTNTAQITATGETTPTDNRSDVNSQVYRLALTSFCSPQPGVYRTWRVTNIGPQDVSFSWLVQATAISSTQFVTNNSQVFFDTPAGGGNVLIISIGGVTHDVKASQGGCPDLTLSKGASPNPVLAGQPLTYTLVYTSLGPNIASGVLITDGLPAGVSFGGVVTQPANMSGPVQDGQTLTWTVDTLNANVSGTIIFTVAVGTNAPERITNTAAISTTTPEPNPANNTATQTTNVAYADVFVSKTAQPADVVLPGGTLTWTIAFGNAGNATARDVRIEDVLPDGVQITEPFTFTYTTTTTSTLPYTITSPYTITLPYTYTIMSPYTITLPYTYTIMSPYTSTLPYTYTITSPYTYTITSTRASWFISELAPGTTGMIVFTGTAATQDIASNTLLNQVQISSSTPQTNTTNDAASATTLRAALAFSKQASRSPVIVGEAVSFTIRLSNTGGVTLTNLPLTDAFDAAVLQYVSASLAPSSTAAGVLSWTDVGPIAPNAEASVVLTFTALQQTNGLSTTNRVTTTASFSGTVLPLLGAAADLRITQPALSISKASSANGIARPGERITYTIAIRNAGDADAVGVSLSDTLPANTSGADFAVSNLMVEANTEISFTYSITALQPLISGTVIVNRVTLSSPTAARDMMTATATVTDVIASSHALSISKVADAATVIAGTRLTYTIAYTLTGTEAAQNVTIVDTLPASVTLISAVPTLTTQIGEQLIWNLGTQTPITNYQLLITVLVPSNIPTGTLLGNVVTITDSNGGVTSNAAVTTPVLAFSDPFIGKFAGPDPLVAGETLTFTLVFTNGGPSDAQNVVISDPLPSSVNYGGIVSAVPDVKPVVNGNVLAFNIGTLAAGASGEVIFTATVNLDAGVVITNEATITTTTPDANPINNTARSSTRVTYADVYVRKDVSPTAPVLAGEVLTWTIAFGNAGGAVAREVSIVDALPSGARTADPFTYTITYMPTPTPTLTPTRATWQLGDLPPGASGQIVFTMTADTATGLDAILINLVLINTTTPQTNTINDTARTTNPKLDLGVSKTAARNPVVVGELVSYTLTAYNNGASPLASVALTDTFDAAFVQFVSASRAPDVNTAGQLAWNNVGPIAIDARASVVVTFTALQPTNGLTTVNAVTATGQFTGSSPLSVKDTAALRITQPLLSVSKASSVRDDGNGFVQPGQRITYTLLISNAGDADALGVALSDTLPANTLGETFSVSGITVRAHSQVTFTYSITALQPLANGTPIVNTVSVTSSNSRLLTPTATVTDTIGNVVFGTDLNILKTVEPSVVANGGLVTFTLVVSNPGPSDIAAPEPITIPGELANTLGPAQPYPASIVVADDAQITDITVTLAALSHGFGADLDVLLVGPNGQRVLLMSDAGGIHFISSVSLNFHDGAPALPDIDPIPSGVYAPTDYVGNDNVETLPAPAPARPYGELLSAFKGTNMKGEWKLFIYDDQDNDVGGALRGWALTLATTQGNKSYSFAQGMRVLDTLPPGFTLMSASPGYAGPNPVAWVDGIGAGETRTYTMTARANRAGSDLATNTAIVTSPLPELNLSDNTSSADVLINSASLTVITPTLPVTPTPPGGVLTLTLPISNSGNITATGGVITITLPNGEVLVFPIADIPPGTSTTVEITVTVPLLPPGTTQVDIVIVVGSSGVDATPEDNTFVVSAPVDGLPRVAIAKTADPPAGTSVRVGDRINYTLLVTNVGAVTMTNVILTDTVPLNTRYMTDTAQPAPSSSNPFVWRLPSLAASAVFTAQFSVVVTGVGIGTQPITNVAVLGGDLLTPTQSNPVLHVYLPSAIRLLGFTAQRTPAGVQVAWAIGAEVNTFGFALYRSATGARADAVRVTDELIAAKGATGASYGWLDATAQPDMSYTYWLQEIETSGRVNEYGPATLAAPNLPKGGPSQVFLPLVVRE